MNKKLLYHFPTPFAAFVEARRLESFINDPNLLPAYASSTIKILPYQIAAAKFAMRSEYLKGCILCDEGSLGKTYEALLIIAQKWYEGKENILLILPKNLIPQWEKKLREDFTLPFISWNEKNQGKGIVLISYEQAVRNASLLEKTMWNLVVFDEADFLFKPENKSVMALKKAVGNAFKLLLTPTPITLSIMDIYGLIHFIDENLLPDSKEFYKRYYKKPENYSELALWTSQFAFRTLKKQVSNYVNFTQRIPLIANYTLNKDDLKLYELTEKYLHLPQKKAYPEMDDYWLSLMFYHTLASSPQAFSHMLKAPIERAKDDELTLLKKMELQANKIKINGKIIYLLKVLKTIFKHLKSRKENQKVIIFVNNLITTDTLYNALQEKGYFLTKSLDEFRNNKKTQILLTSDKLAKGVDIEFCPVVVNYDLLYNAVEMEQRICRCHRQGQQSDVLVISLLSPQNLSDVRILELINKRTFQFDNIFGLSDNIVDNFESSIDEVLRKRRLRDEIQKDFKENLTIHKKENEEKVTQAEDILFTTFTKTIASNVMVSPKYIEEKADAVNKDLWEIVKYYFQMQQPDYMIDENEKTITLENGNERQPLFYYWTGTHNRLYTGQVKYGANKNFKPAYNRITPTSVIARGALRELECPSEGSITVLTDIEPCEIRFYAIDVRGKSKTYTTCWSDGTEVLKVYYALSGITKNGRLLSHRECWDILKLPIVNWQGNTIKCHGNSCYSLLKNETFYPNDTLGEDTIKKYLKEKNKVIQNDIDLIKLNSIRKKTIMEQSLLELRESMKEIEDILFRSNHDRIKELQIKKHLSDLKTEFKRKEELLFMDKIKIDLVEEKEINLLTSEEGIFARPHLIFKVCVQGKSFEK